MQTTQHYNHDKKPKDKPERSIDRKKDNRKIWFFCEGGCGWQYPTADGRCPICNRRYIRQSTYEAVVKRFLLIYEENKKVIDKHLKMQVDIQNDFVIPVELGKVGYYFIPLKHFIQLANIERTDRSQYATFIEYLKEHCKKVNL